MHVDEPAALVAPAGQAVHDVSPALLYELAPQTVFLFWSRRAHRGDHECQLVAAARPNETPRGVRTGALKRVARSAGSVASVARAGRGAGGARALRDWARLARRRKSVAVGTCQAFCLPCISARPRQQRMVRDAGVSATRRATLATPGEGGRASYAGKVHCWRRRCQRGNQCNAACWPNQLQHSRPSTHTSPRLRHSLRPTGS